MRETGEAARKRNVIQGLVSTIIPVYNRAEMLLEAVESVTRQSYEAIEIIVVDDGSDDDTPRAIKGLAARSPCAIHSMWQNNQGPGAARESGRSLARGEFIQYLDSDDLLLPDKFRLQVEALRRLPGCGIAYGKTHHSGIGDALEPIAFKRTGERLEHLFPALLRSRWWSTSTPLYRRTVTDKIGPWAPLWNEEDWEYEARAGSLGVKLAYCDEFVSVTRWHDDRLHHGGGDDPVKLVDRARAHELVYQHASRAGIDSEHEDMRHFSRELFLLSRQCGAAGLPDQSKRLFDLARQAATAERANGIDFRLYRALAGTIGWRHAGRFATFTDRLKH